MRHWIFSQPVLMSLLIASLPVCAQQSSTSTPPTSTSATTPPASSTSTTTTEPSQPTQSQPPPSTTAPAAPSDETLKKAKAVGLHAETRKGATVYCYEDANIGTHFTTKKCVDASQLDTLIAQRQANKDATLQRPMTGTSSR